MTASNITALLALHRKEYYPVVAFNTATDHLMSFDFSAKNQALTDEVITNVDALSNYVQQQMAVSNSKFGIGGYNEERVLYQRSKLFDGTEPRNVHLGIDIWGESGTPVYAPLGGMIHSVAFNDHDGDYGATLILQHQLDTIVFHTLYGHISLADIEKYHEGMYLSRGQKIAHFGQLHENGNWPPHLHFQVIVDMELKSGDYPGVCRKSESLKYLANCPDPDLILNMQQFLA